MGSSIPSIPEKMKALRLVKYNENYELQNDVPVPKPGPNEVLVKIGAAGFCHTDYQVHEGAYKTPLPHIGSHEPTGTIAALGPSIDGDWKVGDRVGVWLFSKPCEKCAACKWYASANNGTYNPRFCANKTMPGILGADGGFAEYMLAHDSTLMSVPDNLSFEQTAPLMCAGATVWNAIIEAGIQKGQTIAIVGIGGLGLLAVQFAKALGYRVVAVHHRDATSRIAQLHEDLRADLVVDYTKPEAVDQISEFTDGIFLDRAVVCTDDVPASDWILHQLHPKGTGIFLGIPEQGFTLDAFNLIFREIEVKGTLHCSKERMEDMMKLVSQKPIRSNITVVPLGEAAALPEKTHHREYPGKPVVTMY